jgi:hypothetical protein
MESDLPLEPATNRARIHTKKEWEAMKPRIEYLYLTVDLTLRDVQWRLERDFNIRVTYDTPHIQRQRSHLL